MRPPACSPRPRGRCCASCRARRRSVARCRNCSTGPSGVEVVPLHGSLDAPEQDLALRPSDRRRVIVATNIAETSLTVPGVTAVVDAGLQKTARYDAERGIDSLETERISMDAADQRAGRAGRLAPGVVRRLWEARDRLRPHREPEIHRVDLASTALDVIAWGGDPRTFEWFERPGEDALDAALVLLARLGLIAATAGSAQSASRCGDCRCTRGSRACWSRQAARRRSHRRARCCPSATCWRRAPRPPAPICCRRSISGARCRRTSTASRGRFESLSDLGARPSRLSEEQFLRAILVWVSRPRRAAPGARIPRRPARVRHRRHRRGGERRPRRRIPRRSRCQPRSATWFAVRRPGVAARPDPHRQPHRARLAAGRPRPRSSTASTKTAGRFAPSPSIATTPWCSRNVRWRSIRKSPPVCWPRRGSPAVRARMTPRCSGVFDSLDARRMSRRSCAPPRTAPAVSTRCASSACSHPTSPRALARDAPETLLVPSGRHVPLVYNDDGSVRRR